MPNTSQSVLNKQFDQFACATPKVLLLMSAGVSAVGVERCGNDLLAASYFLVKITEIVLKDNQC